MTSSLQPPAPGLRERKKQQTRELIAHVALELFDRQGFAATTIPQIAHAADVSPRTVSSYFPAKEELLFPDTEATFDRLEARLGARETGETMAEALRGWIAAEAPDWQARETDAVIQRRVIAAEPDLQHWMRRYMARGEQLIARGIADDLGCEPDDLIARMASAATMAVFGVLDADKHASGDPSCAIKDQDPLPGDAVAMLDQALLFVSAGIRALQIARAEG
jgi:AcrR family transcriptional regulator